jgi:hypothetical protein
MLAIVSRGCSIVDSIAVYIWARRAGLPRQVQSRGRGTLKEDSGAEQQRRCKGGAGRNSSITMEFMVNAVQLSTERASTAFPLPDIFIPQAKKSRFRQGPESAADQNLTIECGAGEGNRTLVSSLGSWRSTIELHPRWEEVNGDR